MLSCRSHSRSTNSRLALNDWYVRIPSDRSPLQTSRSRLSRKVRRKSGRATPPIAAQKSLGSLDSYDSHDEDTIQELLEAQQNEDASARGQSVALYIGGAFLFGLGIWATNGPTKAEEFFAGYLLEQSLSVDNLFVFILVFNYFKTPVKSQAKVLTYGLISAAFLRLSLIVVGAELIENFQPALLLFAGILLYSSYGLLVKNEDEDDSDLSDNQIVKVCRQFVNVSEEYDGDKFFTVLEGNIKRATPLLLVLAVIEISDVVFAVDSIPAVFGVTTDPFIVWTSNMWALLSLRSLYTFVAVAMGKLHYLDKSIAAVLAWISIKLFAEFFGFDISTALSLGVVASTLGAGVGASLLFPPKEEEK